LFRSHPYGGDEDLKRLKSLVASIWEEEGPLSPFTICDFDWRLFQHPGIDPTRRIRIWETEHGDPVGFVWYTPPGDVDVVLAPAHREMSVFLPMLEWSLERHRSEGADGDPLGIWVMESDVSLPFLLRRLGFAHGDRQYFHLLWEPDHTMPAPVLPDGYRFGQVGPEDLDRRVEVHRAAFDPSRLTRESYRDLMRSHGYRSELDVVIEASDGSFAAFALGWLERDSGVGQIEPVGTHPGHRGKGLASAASTELLRRLARAGARQVVLSTRARALVDRLYRDLGFRLITRSQRYVRSVQEA
jgi:ribosomal protein S18 acetylase RimI-like enzyme